MTRNINPVIVGEAPSPTATKPVSPLFPFPTRSAGARLWRMTGLNRADYMVGFHRINLLSCYNGKNFNRDAHWAAHNLIGSRLMDGRAVVLLGVRVWLAFGGREDAEPLIWYAACVPAFRPACVALVPNPGGKAPWYQDEHQAGAAANFMRLLAEGDHPDWSAE